jgi:hypothetical protein
VLVTRTFTDREVAGLVSILDQLLTLETDPARWQAAAATTLWEFARQLQVAPLTTAHERTVSAHLDAQARAHPTDAAVFERTKQMVATLTIGKTAPEIVGKDLQGRDLRLSDYRGKVVVLLFSSDWCGICRTLHPYERLEDLLEIL